MHNVYRLLCTSLTAASLVTWTRSYRKTSCRTLWRRHCPVLWVVCQMMKNTTWCWCRRHWWRWVTCSESCSSRTWPSKPLMFCSRLYATDNLCLAVSTPWAPSFSALMLLLGDRISSSRRQFQIPQVAFNEWIRLFANEGSTHTQRHKSI